MAEITWKIYLRIGRAIESRRRTGAPPQRPQMILPEFTWLSVGNFLGEISNLGESSIFSKMLAHVSTIWRSSIE